MPSWPKTEVSSLIRVSLSWNLSTPSLISLSKTTLSPMEATSFIKTSLIIVSHFTTIFSAVLVKISTIFIKIKNLKTSGCSNHMSFCTPTLKIILSPVPREIYSCNVFIKHILKFLYMAKNGPISHNCIPTDNLLEKLIQISSFNTDTSSLHIGFSRNSKRFYHKNPHLLLPSVHLDLSQLMTVWVPKKSEPNSLLIMLKFTCPSPNLPFLNFNWQMAHSVQFLDSIRAIGKSSKASSKTLKIPINSGFKALLLINSGFGTSKPSRISLSSLNYGRPYRLSILWRILHKIKLNSMKGKNSQTIL